MKTYNQLAYYIEDLWTKGFKLSDEEVHFIYFGKKYTGAKEWKAILALELTLKFQQAFDGSFYLGLLELIDENSIRTKKEATALLNDKGFVNLV